MENNKKDSFSSKLGIPGGDIIKSATNIITSVYETERKVWAAKLEHIRQENTNLRNFNRQENTNLRNFNRQENTNLRNFKMKQKGTLNGNSLSLLEKHKLN